MNTIKSLWLRSIVLSTLAKLAGVFKVSCIIGSYTAWFSALPIIMPLSGVWVGLSGSSIVFGLSLAIRMLLEGFFMPLHYLAYHIPGLLAAYSLAVPSRLLHVVLPMACMALFVMHPEGSTAWAYAMYWWIPVGISFMRKPSFFAQALRSTFIAHAVGSVIWIYTVSSMTSAYWMALIPLVAFERITFALGMVVVHHAVLHISQKYHFLGSPRLATSR